MYFDRFDIVEAHYAFACDWYTGQWCPLYARQCRIAKKFKPGASWKGYKSLSDNGKAIYKSLKKRYRHITHPREGVSLKGVK